MFRSPRRLVLSRSVVRRVRLSGSVILACLLVSMVLFASRVPAQADSPSVLWPISGPQPTRWNVLPSTESQLHQSSYGRDRLSRDFTVGLGYDGSIRLHGQHLLHS